MVQHRGLFCVAATVALAVMCASPAHAAVKISTYKVDFSSQLPGVVHHVTVEYTNPIDMPGTNFAVLHLDDVYTVGQNSFSSDLDIVGNIKGFSSLHAGTITTSNVVGNKYISWTNIGSYCGVSGSVCKATFYNTLTNPTGSTYVEIPSKLCFYRANADIGALPNAVACTPVIANQVDGTTGPRISAVLKPRGAFLSQETDLEIEFTNNVYDITKDRGVALVFESDNSSWDVRSGSRGSETAHTFPFVDEFVGFNAANYVASNKRHERFIGVQTFTNELCLAGEACALTFFNAFRMPDTYASNYHFRLKFFDSTVALSDYGIATPLAESDTLYITPQTNLFVDSAVTFSNSCQQTLADINVYLKFAGTLKKDEQITFVFPSAHQDQSRYFVSAVEKIGVEGVSGLVSIGSIKVSNTNTQSYVSVSDFGFVGTLPSFTELRFTLTNAFVNPQNLGSKFNGRLKIFNADATDLTDSGVRSEAEAPTDFFVLESDHQYCSSTTNPLTTDGMAVMWTIFSLFWGGLFFFFTAFFFSFIAMFILRAIWGVNADARGALGLTLVAPK